MRDEELRGRAARESCERVAWDVFETVPVLVPVPTGVRSRRSTSMPHGIFASWHMAAWHALSER